MKNSPPYWNTKESIILPKSVIVSRDISDGAKNTLSFLLLYSDRNEISISQGRIADELGKSDKTINKHFLQLEETRYIVLKRKVGYSHEVLFTSKSIIELSEYQHNIKGVQ